MAGSHAFKSKAQWRWAYATRQPWAREHAEATPSYEALPKRKTQKRSARSLMAAK